MIDGKTSVLGIIGNPVSHSMSPAMHNEAMRECGINGVYVPFHVEDVEKAIAGLRGLNIKGVSVTIPHKQAVIPFLDELDSVAAKIGAVNTIVASKRGNDSLLKGYNTDWLGANRALEDVTVLAAKSVVLLGAGGSARAIGFGLLEAGASVVICSRTESSGRALADELGCDWISIHETDQLSGDIVVNATSVGMAPKTEVSLLNVQQLKRFDVVMDIVYSPIKTQLLKNGEEAGCRTVCGLEMLLYQGVAQFELWFGESAPVELMRNRLYELIS